MRRKSPRPVATATRKSTMALLSLAGKNTETAGMTADF